MKQLMAVLYLVSWAGLAAAQQSGRSTTKTETFAAFQAEVAALKSAQVAWRKVSWKTCLLEGLKESRARGRPVLLWIFIDRPADDARC
jgi:hypothetical protein